MIRQNAFDRHRNRNLVHTALLLAGIFGLMAGVGLILAGRQGLISTTALGILYILMTQQLPAHLWLRLLGVRPPAPWEAPDLYAAVEDLSFRAGLPRAPQLFYLPTPLVNALTGGSLGRSIIALSQGLLRALNTEEVTAVLAHEISHLMHNGLRVLRVAGALARITDLFAFFGQLLILTSIPLLVIGGTPVAWEAILLLLAAPWLSLLMWLALSRTREFDADLGAVELTGNPAGLARALTKLDYYNDRLWRGFFLPGFGRSPSDLLRTHPSTRARISRLMAIAFPNGFWPRTSIGPDGPGWRAA